MVLSQKAQYAVRAVLELSKRQGTGPVKAARVAEAQHLPVRFLENILSQLRQAGLVESVRGKEGGYLVGRNPGEITVGEVLRLIQGPISAVNCAESDTGARPDGEQECPLRPGCVLLPMWSKAHQAMMDVYDGTTFRDLVEQQQAADECEALNYTI